MRRFLLIAGLLLTQAQLNADPVENLRLKVLWILAVGIGKESDTLATIS